MTICYGGLGILCNRYIIFYMFRLNSMQRYELFSIVLFEDLLNIIKKVFFKEND